MIFEIKLLILIDKQSFHLLCQYNYLEKSAIMGLLMSDQFWGGTLISFPIFKKFSFAIKMFRDSNIGANFESCFFLLRTNVDYLDPVLFTRGRHGR